MAYQVKRSIVRILTVLIGLFSYGAYVLANTTSETFTIREFGLYILLIVPTLVVLEILGKIVLDIFNQTDKKQEEPKQMDEFDRIIEYKSVRNFSFAFLGGLFLTFLFMFLLNSLYLPFVLLFLTFYLSGLVLQISYITYYTNGV